MSFLFYTMSYLLFILTNGAMIPTTLQQQNQILACYRILMQYLKPNMNYKAKAYKRDTVHRLWRECMVGIGKDKIAHAQRCRDVILMGSFCLFANVLSGGFKHVK